jgi:thiol-disulfide isomerase/thioredoxin/outer membrane lipoprotein-sorting protein
MSSFRFVVATALGLAALPAFAQVTFDPYSKIPPQHTAAEILEKTIHALESVKSMEYEVRMLATSGAKSDVMYSGITKVIGTPSLPIQYRARFVADDPPTVVLAVSNGDKVRISDGGALIDHPTRVMEDNASEAALPTLQMFDAARFRKALMSKNAIYAGQDDVDGELCYILGLPSLFEGEFGSDTDYYWISAKTGLALSRQRFRVMHGKTWVTLRWILSNVRLNPEIPEETFRYHPTEADSTPAPPAAPVSPTVPKTAGPTARAGEPIPELEVRDSDYNAVSLKQAVEGKATIVTLWAVWCGYCIAEFPAFEKVVEQHPGKVQVIAIGVQDSRLALVEYAKKHPEFHFTFVTDPHLEDRESKISHFFFGEGIPKNAFVNADGKIFDYGEPSFSTREEELFKKVSRWLGETAANRN